MEKIIVTTDTKDNARMIANMLKQLSFVDHVQIESEPIENTQKDSFIYPGNQMTENDIQNMISESESEPYFASPEARQLSLKIIRGWEKQKR